MTQAPARRAPALQPARQTVRATPSFSIIIPTYNEAEDIGATLDAVLAQRLPAHEVIVVDSGSEDGTLALLQERAARDGLVIIDEGRRRGVAAARNTGMRAATGDVVVLLNADVMPEPDFLERLSPLYRDRQADFVSVNASVANTHCVTGRFLQAEHELLYDERSVGWTEGFSCRREAAIAAGFPEEIPGLGGEDVEFFGRLRATNAAWRVAYDIVVPHRVPSSLRAFWAQWRWRGNAIPHIETRLRRRSLLLVAVRRALATLKSIAVAAAIVPNARAAWLRAQRSPRRTRDLPTFWLLLHVQTAAHRYGEWQTLATLWRAGRNGGAR